MKLTIFYDGQYFVGVVEMVSAERLKAYRFVFGAEPSDQEVWEFVDKRLLSLMEQHEQKGIKCDKAAQKRMNPKRLQRKVAKETRQIGVSTKAQEAIKEEYAERKKEKQQKHKLLRLEQVQYKRELKRQKAKQKHKGR
ncbi:MULTISPECIES: YjdF family protein [Bacillaceae]|uniref:YjdF family protein n=1 Tax=Bacillaceae TaxID=186817 RepID=UPI0030000118